MKQAREAEQVRMRSALRPLIIVPHSHRCCDHKLHNIRAAPTTGPEAVQAARGQGGRDRASLQGLRGGGETLPHIIHHAPMTFVLNSRCWARRSGTHVSCCSRWWGCITRRRGSGMRTQPLGTRSSLSMPPWQAMRTAVGDCYRWDISC